MIFLLLVPVCRFMVSSGTYYFGVVNCWNLLIGDLARSLILFMPSLSRISGRSPERSRPFKVKLFELVNGGLIEFCMEYAL